MGKTIVKVSVQQGIPRISLRTENGNRAGGISFPLSEMNPLTITSILVDPNVEMDEETRKMLEKQLEGWL